jgi:alpha-beta hydrolase superfamily lysophospholipase
MLDRNLMKQILIGIECGVRLASARYAVFGIDYEGHGRSTGSRCYIKKFENIVNDCDEFFKSVCGKLATSFHHSLPNATVNL